jgi:tRNA1Val (adenine37-N6)-methyltransferase
MEEETLDEILNGRLRVFQKKKGYRFSLDSILLAHFVSLKPRARAIELGCGSGIILIILAKHFPYVDFSGLEIQEELANMARKNIEINSLDGMVKIFTGDAKIALDIFNASLFDAVIFNPPYRKLNSGRINPILEKALARHEIRGSLKVFLNAAKYLLKPEGKVFTVYPAKRLIELVSLFRENAIEPKRIKVVFSDFLSDAEFILVEGRLDGREELKIETPLFIYQEDKTYTNEMNNIFNDLARFPADGGG